MQSSNLKTRSKTKGEVVEQLDFLTDHVTDISPLRGFNGLSALSCNSSSKLSATSLSLSPLKGLPLSQLCCRNRNVNDLSPLLGMKLTRLDIESTAVQDLSPLEGMPLYDLRIGAIPLSDLSPIKGMLLTTLHCSATQVSDLSPLKGMPLQTLGCFSTQVSDLSPLMGMSKLSGLNVRSTKVTPAAVAALQKALPKCKIEWDDPSKAKTPQPAASGTK